MQRLLLAFLCLGFGVSCGPSEPQAYAKRITAPNELIGGTSPLGTLGDWLLGNDQIQVVVQDEGWSRGFGIFGGGIIDADLVRPGSGSNSPQSGRDKFGEFFPILFLQAFDVQSYNDVDPLTGKSKAHYDAVEVISDGSDGGSAVLRTRAYGGDFITMIATLLGAAIGDQSLRFETDYVLKPGARHVEVIGRLNNFGSTDVDLSGNALKSLIEGQLGVQIDGVQLPLGDVTLFGNQNKTYVSGVVDRSAQGLPPKPVGFDLRYGIEASHRIERDLPALPGLVADFIATSAPDVSYGYAAADSDSNYVYLNRAEYEKDPHAHITKHSLLLPFLVSSFTGAYVAVPQIF